MIRCFPQKNGYLKNAHLLENSLFKKYFKIHKSVFHKIKRKEFISLKKYLYISKKNLKVFQEIHFMIWSFFFWIQNTALDNCSYYKKLTIGLLDKCYGESQMDTCRLLTRSLEEWGYLSCMNFITDLKDIVNIFLSYL